MNEQASSRNYVVISKINIHKYSNKKLEKK